MAVDDSALIRSLPTNIVDAQRDMAMVGAAPDTLVARGAIKSLNPHQPTLAIEMPRIDGLELHEKLRGRGRCRW